MNRGWKRFAPAFVILAMSVLPAQALAELPASSAPPAGQGYLMPATQAWDMASDSGAVYRILVSAPKAEAPADGYPVLYVLDGNAVFATFAEARRLQEYGGYDAGKVLVVGVGYPTDEAYDVRRLDDYTPPLLDPPPARWRGLAKYRSGGRDRFLDFLTGRLREEIGGRYRIDPLRQSLFGHSLGGLLGLHALYTRYTRPQAFESIVAASPSLEWNDQGVLREEREFAARLTAGKVSTSRLLVVVGGQDVDDDPRAGESFARRIDQALSGHGLRVRFRRYEEEGHMGVPTRAVNDTLRFVAEWH